MKDLERLLKEFSETLIERPDKHPESVFHELNRELRRKGDLSTLFSLYRACCYQLANWNQLANLFSLSEKEEETLDKSQLVEYPRPLG